MDLTSTMHKMRAISAMDVLIEAEPEALNVREIMTKIHHRGLALSYDQIQGALIWGLEHPMELGTPVQLVYDKTTERWSVKPSYTHTVADSIAAGEPPFTVPDKGMIKGQLMRYGPKSGQYIQSLKDARDYINWQYEQGLITMKEMDNALIIADAEYQA